MLRLSVLSRKSDCVHKHGFVCAGHDDDREILAKGSRTMLLGSLRLSRLYRYAQELNNFDINTVVNSAKHQQLHIAMEEKAMQDSESPS